MPKKRNPLLDLIEVYHEPDSDDWMSYKELEKETGVERQALRRIMEQKVKSGEAEEKKFKARGSSRATGVSHFRKIGK